MGLVLLAACKDDQQQPAQYPQQPYQQQPYQQQPYQQQPYAQPQPTYTQPAPTTTTPGTTGGQTATAIPGVMKNADGTCSITLPSMTGQPSAPIVGACPPGI